MQATADAAAIDNSQTDEGDVRRTVVELVWQEDVEVIDPLEWSERLMDVLAARPELEEAGATPNVSSSTVTSRNCPSTPHQSK